jgi:hypothetical protein
MDNHKTSFEQTDNIIIKIKRTKKETMEFGDNIDRIYPIENRIKDTTDISRSASYLVLHMGMEGDFPLQDGVGFLPFYFRALQK